MHTLNTQTTNEQELQSNLNVTDEQPRQMDFRETKKSEARLIRTNVDVTNISTLATYNIETYNMQWEAYHDAIVKSWELVDFNFIVTDPPYCLPESRVKTGIGYEDHIDDKEMKMYTQFARIVMKPGDYCVLQALSSRQVSFVSTSCTNENL